jgi:hypothetical protein
MCPPIVHAQIVCLLSGACDLCLALSDLTWLSNVSYKVKVNIPCLCHAFTFLSIVLHHQSNPASSHHPLSLSLLYHCTLLLPAFAIQLLAIAGQCYISKKQHYLPCVTNLGRGLIINYNDVR